jgi:hypothetical protein
LYDVGKHYTSIKDSFGFNVPINCDYLMRARESYRFQITFKTPPSGGGEHSPADGCGWGVFVVC